MWWKRTVFALVVLAAGCSANQVGQWTLALATVPFVDRTEKEINDWFDNRTIVNDQAKVPGAMNGEPSILFINKGADLIVNGTAYPGVLCITQFNTLPGQSQKLKYAARVGIEVLNNPNLFQCGQVQLGSCDGGPMAANVGSLQTKSELRAAFRQAVNQWLTDDVVAVLKSTTNTEGFADPSNATPRAPAKTKGSLYNMHETSAAPIVRVIGFFAQ